MQATTTPAGEAEQTRLCQVGSKTRRPCWRPATEANLGEPTLCPEHMQLRRGAEEHSQNALRLLEDAL